MKSLAEYELEIAQAVETVERRWKQRPRVGIVLGTGSGAVADEIKTEQRWPFESLPHFAPSTALGHRGALLCGSWNDQPVVAMQGRLHLYEGRARADTIRPIRLMLGLGIQQLLISNAAGGINPQFRVGDLMLIESFIDLFFRNDLPSTKLSDPWAARAVGRPDQACEQKLIDRAMEIGRTRGLRIQRGVYAGLLGPSYETRAEYRMCRRIGADAVGMSTIPEIVVASQNEVPVLAVSIITNMATTSGAAPTTGHGVVASAESAAQGLSAIFAGLLE